MGGASAAAGHWGAECMPPVAVLALACRPACPECSAACCPLRKRRSAAHDVERGAPCRLVLQVPSAVWTFQPSAASGNGSGASGGSTPASQCGAPSTAGSSTATGSSAPAAQGAGTSSANPVLGSVAAGLAGCAAPTVGQPAAASPLALAAAAAASDEETQQASGAVAASASPVASVNTPPAAQLGPALKPAA